MNDRPETPKLQDFPTSITETLRFRDTDMLGHVNNAVFATLFETGRVHEMFEDGRNVCPAGTAFVLARLNIDFLKELNWTDTPVVASGVERIGNSSITVKQAIFAGEKCVAIGESIMVLMDETTRRSTPLPDELRARFEKIKFKG